VFAEDWGWCVMLQRRPFPLWLGCVNFHSHLHAEISPDAKSNYVPKDKDMTWSCSVGYDITIFQKFFWRRLFGRANERETLAKADAQLLRVLESEPTIELVETP
jgi:hypothetical protein